MAAVLACLGARMRAGPAPDSWGARAAAGLLRVRKAAGTGQTLFREHQTWEGLNVSKRYPHPLYK